MIVITSNEKLKQKTFLHHHVFPSKLLISTYSDNCFFFFFLNHTDDAVNLHQCQTLSLDKHFRKRTQELGDTKLLAKLREGDMIATEAIITIITVLQDYTMSIMITTQRNCLKIGL